MKELDDEAYPVYLHTQLESYRAIKLYSDFGFKLISDERVGSRQNDLVECLPLLKEYMTGWAFEKLQVTKAPEYFLSKLEEFKSIEF